MTATPGNGSPWEEAGRVVADALDGISSAVVVAADPVTAAQAALGIARAQSRRRRVAVADLVGDVGPLAELVADEDAHGIVDSFHFGVSLNKIARQVDGIGNLFVMPSGTEPLEHAELLRHDRWRRLTSGFREVGALLLVVAPLEAEGLDAIGSVTEGFVAVGPVAERLPAEARVLAIVSAPRTTRRFPAPPESGDPSAIPLPPRPSYAERHSAERAAAEAPMLPATGTPDASATLPERRRTKRLPLPVGHRWLVPAILVALVMLGVVTGRFLMRDRARRAAARATPTRVDSAARRAAPRDTAPALVVANPQDSATAAPWTVEVLMSNTEAGAGLKARDDLRDLPLATWSPVVPAGDSVPWYRVTVGGYADRAAADSLLRELRSRGLVRADAGSVLRAPFSLLLRDAVPRDSAAALAGRWRARGVPAFALDAAGVVRLYAGVYETPDQASLLATSLKAAGVAPVAAYRIGRVF